MTNSQSFSNKPSSQSSATSATVGGLLRETRKRAGIGIADGARALRISQKYLEALEDDRHADLPGAAYAIGFVRSYAEHLHLDGEEVVRRYKVEAAGLNGKKDLVFPKPMSDSGVPGGAVLGLGIIFAGLAYGLWYWNTTEGVVDAARVGTVPEFMASATDKASGTAPETTSAAAEGTPESTSEATPAAAPEATPEVAGAVDSTSELTPKASVAPESPEDTSSPQDTAEAVPAQALKKMATEVDAAPEAPEAKVRTAESAADAAGKLADQAPTTSAAEPMKAPDSVPSVDKTPPVPAQVDSAPVKPAPTVVAPTIAAPPAVSAPTVAAPTVAAPVSTEPVSTAERQNEGPSRITVRALSNSWIQVRDEVADRLLFTRLLRKGDEYKVPNRSGLRLMTGNAGALELRVDDVAAPSIGAVGEVRRSVELDVEKLKAGTAVSE